jgi:hypothetical protein
LRLVRGYSGADCIVMVYCRLFTRYESAPDKDFSLVRGIISLSDLLPYGREEDGCDYLNADVVLSFCYIRGAYWMHCLHNSCAIGMCGLYNRS